MKKLWRLWCLCMGSKATGNDTESDVVATYRTLWNLLHIITCFAIIANAIHQW